MIVQLKNSLSNVPRNLSRYKHYLVLGISANDFRVLNDRDDPVLYEPELFAIIDDTEPDDWDSQYGEGGERYAYPRDLPKYVWEEYHDDVPEAVNIINGYLKRVGPCSWNAPS